MEIIEIDCIFCNKTSDNVVIEENGYEGKQCRECGLIFISPRPDFQDIVDLYGHDNAHISAAAHIDSSYLKRLYARHHLNIIKTHTSEGSILDIGAGAGNFLDEARDAGFTPYGIEFNPEQAGHIQDNLDIPCVQTSVQPGIFNNQIFDVVYHCDVISHFYDPIADFKTANAIMHKGSLLVFETGNLGDVDHKYFKHIQRFQYPDHLFFYSTKNIEKLLESTGFELLEIHRYSLSYQMRLVNLSNKVKGILKKILSRSNASNATELDEITFQPTNKPIANDNKNLFGFATLYKYLNYLARYKLGANTKKFSAPQTLVVVAKKRDDVS